MTEYKIHTWSRNVQVSSARLISILWKLKVLPHNIKIMTGEEDRLINRFGEREKRVRLYTVGFEL